jgi:chromosome segregation ATPase
MNDGGALERFKALEGRISKTLRVLEEAREEKRRSDAKLVEARQQIVELQAEIKGMRKERKVVRGRVEGLIARIDALGKRQEEQVV